MRKNCKTCIVGEKVILIPYRKEHVSKYNEWMKSKELQFLTGSIPLTLEEEYKMQQEWMEDETKCTFIILDKEVYKKTGCEIDAMIGDTNLFFNNVHNVNTAEIEIMIAEPEFRNNGRGTESTILMILYANYLSVKVLEAKIAMVNQQSIHLFDKLMFNEIGKSEIFQEITYERKLSEDYIHWLKSKSVNWDLKIYHPNFPVE